MNDDEQNAVRALWDALSQILENPDNKLTTADRMQGRRAIRAAATAFKDDAITE